MNFIERFFLHLFRGLFINVNTYTVYFHVFIGADHNIRYTADNTGLHKICSLGIYLDYNIGSCHLKFTVIDDVLRQYRNNLCIDIFG